jgi:hypothetical protein
LNADRVAPILFVALIAALLGLVAAFVGLLAGARPRGFANCGRAIEK